MSYDYIAQKLARGETIILDGGTGTDIQRRGVPMNGLTWCAEANLTHPDVVREVQGVGSGADVAASVRGGIVLYRAEPMELEVLPHVHPFTAVYSGSKRPTPEVIALVEERRRHYPKVFEAIFEAMERCTLNAADAVAMQDWRTFGAMMDVAQGLMDALGVNNAALSDIVHALRSDPGILGAKISGSGLGDCAIGLGRLEGGPWTREVMPVGIDRKGIHLEEG